MSGKPDNYRYYNLSSPFDVYSFSDISWAVQVCWLQNIAVQYNTLGTCERGLRDPVLKCWCSEATTNAAAFQLYFSMSVSKGIQARPHGKERAARGNPLRGPTVRLNEGKGSLSGQQKKEEILWKACENHTPYLTTVQFSLLKTTFASFKERWEHVLITVKKHWKVLWK